MSRGHKACRGGGEGKEAGKVARKTKRKGRRGHGPLSKKKKKKKKKSKPNILHGSGNPVIAKNKKKKNM